MRIVVAPDSFKGSVSAVGTAAAMEKGIKAVFPEAEVIQLPIADGGEGTVEALVTATQGTILHQEVVGPLSDKVKAFWGILGDGETAVLEMAAASGLPLVPEGRKNPLITTTYGTGQLIKAALDKGLRKIIIGIGGSATNDGGSGMAQALGAKFLDESGQELPMGGAALAQLAQVELTQLDERLKETVILVACDVDNPLCGSRGASAVYGPQKGATPEMVAQLDAALQHFASKVQPVVGKQVIDYPGAGAAGGLGAGLLLFTNAVLRPGVEIVLEALQFEKWVEGASLVITGEGRTDFQTAFGKAPVGVAKLAKRYKVPVVCLSGGLGQGYEDVLQQGIDGVTSISPGPISLEECISQGAQLIQKGTERLCQIVKVGMEVKA